MELYEFNNGIEEHNRLIEATINEYGIYVMHEEGREGAYSYTVGLKKLNTSELIVFDVNPKTARDSFLMIFQSLQHGFDFVTSCRNTNEPLGVSAKVDVYPEIEKKQRFYAARTFYGDWRFDTMVLTLGAAG